MEKLIVGVTAETEETLRVALKVALGSKRISAYRIKSGPLIELSSTVGMPGWIELPCSHGPRMLARIIKRHFDEADGLSLPMKDGVDGTSHSGWRLISDVDGIRVEFWWVYYGK